MLHPECIICKFYVHVTIERNFLVLCCALGEWGGVTLNDLERVAQSEQEGSTIEKLERFLRKNKDNLTMVRLTEKIIKDLEKKSITCCSKFKLKKV